ncbi:cryptochrome/photolyase family protein [Shewanella litorisediminis]|uniref:Cryptochrome/photolyase family protein n=1 Tax=Shewanella litorisediminis TaxID=1173586 RepID=A0ABX7G0E7_9GAMM|nr:cryptochrome/photolyase family protein [Shewanella litorisediminis]MCL2918162.1 cryptochrome/photolyase family protein [Shewanella litorisediminis]QRH00782.1 cryptochrome/photolyase family protein [Shewanella litorisediminis]
MLPQSPKGHFQYHTLRLILGDQLSSLHSWFSQRDDGVLYLIAELKQENSYVTHHIQKVCAFFAAMADFAKCLKAAGHEVLHLTLDDTAEFADLPGLLTHVLQLTGASRFEYQRPDEYRLLSQLGAFDVPGVQIALVDSEHFLLPFDEIDTHFPKGKHILMESFYRRMRKRFNILMDGAKPMGGQWNFDASNRNKLKAGDMAGLPQPLLFANDISEIVSRLQRHGIVTIGHLEPGEKQTLKNAGEASASGDLFAPLTQPDPELESDIDSASQTTKNTLLWPINREQSLALLDHFCRYCLPLFGRFQDAMTAKHPSAWSLYHSRLSFSINSKLLHPAEVIDAAISTYEASCVHGASGAVDMAQVEGFIRQILGWREYVRGVYWANMPDYAGLNALGAQNRLPGYFWHGNTRMNCMRHAIGQSLDYAYAHHIQRLMITGNFCLLTDIAPKQVDDWYLGIYVDAIEWVEMPNTRGMALFADGGIVGTKPYAASGAYINKMSDYCQSCHYDIKAKSGPGSCPFNSLYWRFMNKHAERLSANHRIGMIFSSWYKMEEAQRDAILTTAEQYIADLECL